MKGIFIICISFLLINLSYGQIGQHDRETLVINLEEGPSFQINAHVISNRKDTAQITISKVISNTSSTEIQQFLLPTAYPMEMESISINNLQGFTFKYDPAAKNGNRFLYLFNEERSEFQEVEGYWNLGWIETISVNGKDYMYGYRSCGCADNCWKSEWFEVNEHKVISNASIGCDCQSIIENGTKLQDDCTKFLYNHKFEAIKEYWIEQIKSKL